QVRPMRDSAISAFLAWCRQHPLAVALLGVLAAAAAISLKVGIANGLAGGTDFQWSTSRQLLAHEDPYALFLAYARGEGGDPPFLSQRPNYPPTALLLLFPYAALPWPLARAAWVATNILALTCIGALLARLYFAPGTRLLAFIVLALLMAASTPVRVALQVGQHCVASLVFFCAALAAERA